MIREESRGEDEGRRGKGGSEPMDSEEGETEAEDDGETEGEVGGDKSDEEEEDLEEERDPQTEGDENLLLFVMTRSFIPSGSEEEGMKGRGRGRGRGRGEERKKRASSKKEERFDLQNG